MQFQRTLFVVARSFDENGNGKRRHAEVDMTSRPGIRLVTAIAVAALGSVIVLTPNSSFGQITSTRSRTFGGNGGASFDHSPSNIETWGRIRQIVVRHGNQVDAIGVLYANGNF